MNINLFNKITSIKLFIATVLLTSIFFFFIDLSLFKFTRNFNASIFNFFNNYIDPLSEILDPLNFLILSFINLIILFNYQNKLKIPEKLDYLILKSGKTKEELSSSINYFIQFFYHVILSILVSGLVCHLIKYILGVARPRYFFLESYDRFNFFNIEHKVNSLPSGHTQAAFTIAILMIIYLNKYYFIIIFTSVLLALSRIFLSMHFPSDLILGAYIGCLFPVILYKHIFMKKLERFKKNRVLNFNYYIKLLYFRLVI